VIGGQPRILYHMESRPRQTWGDGLAARRNSPDAKPAFARREVVSRREIVWPAHTSYKVAPQSADVRVKEPARGSQQSIRHQRKNRLDQFHSPLSSNGIIRRARKSPVGQFSRISCPLVLEGDETRIVQLRASKIKFSRAAGLRCTHCSPQEKRNGS
jgi:hypothetical protein